MVFLSIPLRSFILPLVLASYFPGQLHATPNASFFAPVPIGHGLLVLSDGAPQRALPSTLVSSTGTAWTFGLLIQAMIYVAAGICSPVRYFRF